MKHWVLSNQAFSEEFFSILQPVDKLPTVFAILEGLHRRDPAKFARYSSLALAIAVVYDVPPPPWWPHVQVSPEALSRKLPNPAAPFDWLTHEDMVGHTYHRLTRLRAEELKFVVDAAAPIPELAWSQEAVPYPLDAFDGAYQMVKYRTDRTATESMMTWSGQPYTLQAILAEGGICVDQAYFASEAGKARGIPTLLFLGSGQDLSLIHISRARRPVLLRRRLTQQQHPPSQSRTLRWTSPRPRCRRTPNPRRPMTCGPGTSAARRRRARRPEAPSQRRQRSPNARTSPYDRHGNRAREREWKGAMFDGPQSKDQKRTRMDLFVGTSSRSPCLLYTSRCV